MESAIGTASTRDGRPIVVRRVVAPDATWGGLIAPFLAHKGSLWRWQIEQLLNHSFEPLVFRSYLADLAAPGQPPLIAGHICTIESQDVGLFGHVFTLPAFRGQSIARVLTGAVMNDFASRGGLAMWLGTDFDSTAYRVYQQFGYRPIRPGSGLMAWFAPGGAAELDRRFAPGQATRVRPVGWPDYATLNALSARATGSPQRSTILPVCGQTIVEESLLGVLRDPEHGHGPIGMKVLVTDRDWPVGWAITQADLAGRLAPQPAEHPPIVLDVFAHPGYESAYADLIASADLPANGPVVSLVDSCDAARQAALAAAGFASVGRLADLYRWAGELVDLIVMSRGVHPKGALRRPTLNDE